MHHSLDSKQLTVVAVGAFVGLLAVTITLPAISSRNVSFAEDETTGTMEETQGGIEPLQGTEGGSVDCQNFLNAAPSSSTATVRVTPWNPSIEELPPSDDYTFVNLGQVPDPDWAFTLDTAYPIDHVLVAPPEYSLEYPPEYPPFPYTIGVDYDGSFRENKLCIEFYEVGFYVVQIRFQQPIDPTLSPLSAAIYIVAVGIASEALAVAEPKGATEMISLPGADPGAWIVSKNAEGEDDATDAGMVWLQTQIGVTVQRANSVTTAIDLLKAAHQQAGRRIKAVLSGHGWPNGISVGIGRGTRVDGRYLQGNRPEVQTFITELKGKIYDLYLLSCCTGEGMDDVSRIHLVNALGAGLLVRGAGLAGNVRITAIAGPIWTLPSTRHRSFLIEKGTSIHRITFGG